MTSQLHDLDELVLKCRDLNAKNYIGEAVSCYKVGAFRSAIVSTWIAVSFDIIDKLKELTLAGDKEAEKQIEDFERARRIGDISTSLRFERDILAVCRDKLELIAPIEFIDLNRLQEDRNRCAHPSMIADGKMFMPSAELARMHIRSAVEHLLQHPPAQGKYALDYLISEVESEYFPTNIKKAIVAFENSPLKKARDSLVRNFTVVLLKKFLSEDIDYKTLYRISTALNAVGVIHREIYINTLSQKLSSILRSLNPEKYEKIIDLLEHIDDCWNYFDLDVKQKVEAYVHRLPKDKLERIHVFLSVPELKAQAEQRLKLATRSELADVLYFEASPQVFDRIIVLYSESANFDQANSFASTVIRYATEFSKDQVRKLIDACGNNDQIEHSYEIGSVINALRKNSNVNEEEINQWLKNVNLMQFIKEKSIEE